MSRRLFPQYYVIALALLVCQCLLFASAEEEEPEAKAAGSKGRQRAKEWYLTKIKVGGVELPFDYVTLVIGIGSIYILYNGLMSSDAKPSCTASHILISDHEDATKAKMEEFKKTIGDDKDAFAKCAAENSTCPSKSKGGILGTFPQGAMVPAFDKCCFDPATPLNTTVGPVHTHFGYHLIFIHDRKMPQR
eukprot:scaffold10025_cov180-Amphora_coffeaeformis.AAC.7